jgi:hypothetical protein
LKRKDEIVLVRKKNGVGAAEPAAHAVLEFKTAKTKNFRGRRRKLNGS